MGKQKYTPEIIALVIKMRHDGKTIPEIQAATGMGKPSQQKLYQKLGIKLTEAQKDAAIIGARWKKHAPIVDGHKFCSKCSTNKPIDEFHVNKRRITGRCSSCKECQNQIYLNNSGKKKEQVRKYKQNNPEKIKALASKRYSANPEYFIEKAKAYDKLNPEKALERSRRWGKRNQAHKNHKTAKYRADKIKATPKWLTKAQLEEIRQIYKNCPKGYHVDHIVPLRGKEVSGLHVPWNLQYLPGIENMKKGNKV